MKSKTLALVLGLMLAGVAWAADAKPAEYTLPQLTEKIATLEKQEINLVGTVVGACKSGCKMWVANGKYTDGDPYILVRAKDDAFKFDTKAEGQTVVLKGFAVGQWIDACASDQEKDHAEHKEGTKSTCAGPAVTKTETASTGKTLGEITFFATAVEYRKS
jgi:hypothetical protein